MYKHDYIQWSVLYGLVPHPSPPERGDSGVPALSVKWLVTDYQLLSRSGTVIGLSGPANPIRHRPPYFPASSYLLSTVLRVSTIETAFCAERLGILMGWRR